jgi:hypothetical protein|tara:strand:- start:515 stop:652 length:138 start_codon:yes stop_codon:yes gene_type:complete
MKHPGYSKAKNEYAQRSDTKLSSSGKRALKEELKAFNERLRKLFN